MVVTSFAGIVAQLLAPMTVLRQIASVTLIFLSVSVCLFSSLLIQLRTCRLSDMEEIVKEFAAKLALVPIPPPGQLHLVCVCACVCVFVRACVHYHS